MRSTIFWIIVLLFSCNEQRFLESNINIQNFSNDLKKGFDKGEISLENFHLLRFFLEVRDSSTLSKFKGYKYKDIIDLALNEKELRSGAIHYSEGLVDSLTISFKNNSTNGYFGEDFFNFEISYHNTSNENVSILSTTVVILSPLKEELITLTYRPLSRPDTILKLNPKGIEKEMYRYKLSTFQRELEEKGIRFYSSDDRSKVLENFEILLKSIELAN